MSLTTEIQNVIALAEEFPPDIAELMNAASTVVDAAQTASHDEQKDCLTLLKTPIAKSHMVVSAIVAVMGGAMVETGADPLILLDVTLERVRGLMLDVKRYVEICLEKDLDPNTSMDDLGSDYPREVDSWQSFNYIYRAIIAMTSRSKIGRSQLAADNDLVKSFAALQEYGEGAIWLYKMARVLDDEDLIVLHPTLQKGYHVRISGVADNFQLHTLLADELIGDAVEGWIPHDSRPSTAVVRIVRGELSEAHVTAQGFFNLYNWFAIEPDGRLDSEIAGQKQAWIWNEGIPGDIMPFESQRIILLGEAAYKRTWNAVRIFEAMHPETEVIAQLSDAAVQDWLTKLQEKTIPADKLPPQ
ncbi:MAG: hypothetical protein ACPG7F_13130 [Aggregatilineales bacterium]